MEQKNYRPVTIKDKDYHIKEASGGIYKELKMLMLKSVATSVTDKLVIAREFRLVKDLKDKDELKKFQEDNQKEELSIDEFYEKVFPVLFMEAEDNIKFDVINLNQINRAINDFFTSASGT